MKTCSTRKTKTEWRKALCAAIFIPILFFGSIAGIIWIFFDVLAHTGN